jgi:hypothetical protein
MSADARFLTIALDLVERGLFVFPLGPRSKKPAIPSAHPKGDPRRGKCHGECGREGHGFYDATLDPDQIRWWWTTDPRCGPECNVGVATEASRLLVDDLDPTNDDDGHCSDAFSALCALATDLGGGDLPPTLEVMTPRSGEHHWYAVPEGVDPPPSSAGKIAPHIDVRSAGAYVVGPGSVTDTGEYVVGRDAPVAEAPMWLVDVCRRVKGADRFDRPPVARTVPPAGQTSRRDRYGLKALEGELGRLARAPEGQRHSELYRCSHALGGLVAAGVLSASHVAGEVTYVARRIGLPDDEIEATVTDGLGTGMNRPREVPS